MIELVNVTKIYGKGDNAVTALDDVSFKMETGKFYAIVGKSGSGKSTLLNIIGALDTPTEGSILVGGNNITEYKERDLANFRNTTVGFVFQSFYLEPTYTVEDNVALPLLIADINKKERVRRVNETLEKLGALDLLKKRANELSGGQKQRIALARAIVSNPTIILADEPTGNLDTSNGREVVKILRAFSDDGKTVLMVTHNKEDALYADRVLSIVDGKLIDKNPFLTM